ncbi:MAG: RagB/SusD family nutrient uptake outer membrane protein, partial [Prolixibacteraceae bacterium]|nr:RagB/SusD family nutrient uptake outer membrane protein [Prolixibacteraceae bacterium]
MKLNIVIILLIAASLSLVCGCKKLPLGENFLTKAPGTDVTVDTIFNKMEYAERYLTGAYDYLRYGLVVFNYGNSTKPWTALMGRDNMGSITDEIQSYLPDGGVLALWYSGLYDANTESKGGQNNNYPPGASSRYNFTQEYSWAAIRICYNFIKNVDRVPDSDAAYKKKLKAEAYGIIACMYTDMFRNFGGIPWIDHAYSITESAGQLPRLTAQATCDSIVKLCDKAIADLPFAYQGADLVNFDGRLTGGGMMGLKARALLFNASPLFNASAPYLDGIGAQKKLAWHGGYDAERWKKAMDAAHDLIVKGEATGDYKLYHNPGNSFRQDFQDAYYLRGNGEQLITTRKFFKAPPSTGDVSYSFVFDAWNHGTANCTMELVDAFPMLNGKPITDPTSGYDSTNVYNNRDWRLKETVACLGDVYKGRTVESWIGGRDRLTEASQVTKSGNFLRK